MAQAHVLIIDDEKNLINSLVYGLKGHDIRAVGALTGEEGLALLDSVEPDLVLLDVRLPEISGIEVLGRIKAQRPELPVVMISAHGDTRTAVEAVKAGAEDYFTKPFELEDLVHVIQRTISRIRLAGEIEHRRRQQTGSGSGLIGDSPAMAGLRRQIETVARSRARTVLVLGESGSGKALVARALHAWSARADGPFIEVNCATLPENLLEAELFGAEKGAYTGAHQRRMGLVQLADGGSLFLDEIGELPPDLQAKLLHFLDNHCFRSVGAARERNADVRVIAATNRDVEREVEVGRMRSDLFYRLNVMPITVPPLAARGSDSLQLAEHFADEFAAEEGCPRITYTGDVQACLSDYTWPGNVRELKNLVERLTILYPGQAVTTVQLPPEFRLAGEHARADGLEGKLAVMEREALLQALVDSGGHKGRAAESLGISRHALKRRLRRLDIP